MKGLVLNVKGLCHRLISAIDDESRTVNYNVKDKKVISIVSFICLMATNANKKVGRQNRQNL